MHAPVASSVRRRLGRRIFGSLALAATIPALIAMALAFKSVSDQLEENAYDRLHIEAQNYALAVYARLQLAHKVLSRRIELDAAGDAGLDTYFRKVEPGSAADRALWVKYPEQDSPDPAERAELWLSSAVSGQAGGVRVLMQTDFVFGTPDLFAAGVSYCVLDDLNRPIFCPAEIPAEGHGAWLAALGKNSSGRFAWSARGDERIAAYFTVPLRDDFAFPGFSVAAVQERGLALAPAAGFKQAAVPATGIVVLLTLWFGFRLVRGRLEPLERLTDGASRMAAGDLSTPIQIGSDDEFGLLGHAFEKTRQALGMQFSTQSALAELDRALLDNAEADAVYLSVLSYISDIFACEKAYVIVENGRPGSAATAYASTPDGTCREFDMKVPLAWHRIAAMKTNFYDRDAAADILGSVPELDKAQCYAVTRVASPASVRTAIVLGFNDRATAESLREQTLLDFVDRIAVAQQSLERAERLYRQAHYDGLTGLPNRQLFLDRLEHSVALADGGDRISALLFVDLDNFKSVNDSQGHPVGDALLRLAAQRLRRIVSRKDTAARLGGDEFAVILADIASPEDAELTASAILSAFAEPFEVESVEHFLGGSIGIALIPADGDSASTLLRNADTAMYKAKADGRGRSAFFEEQMNVRAQAHVQINADLRHAIENDELELYYQPKVCLRSGRIASAEALVRWRHPTLGFVPPDQFIPIAERSSLIVDIGDWVANSAFGQLRRWQRSGTLPALAINVSYRQLYENDIETTLLAAAKQHGLDPSSVELEITESIAANDIDRATAVFGNLRAAGFRVAIDDFGTGYSSFGYLTDMVFDTLKIDRIFLDDFPVNPRKRAVVASIVELARSLGKQTVAEGVETAEQRNELALIGCDIAQGYLISAPLCLSDFEDFVNKRFDTVRLRQIG